MTLARILLKLWRLRLWVGVGVVLGGVVAIGSAATSHSTVYATASTQMLVDSPDSALTNANVDLTGYLARAGVFARLMTSGAALDYIGKAAGIDGNLIDANGPIEINGSPTATHAPVAIVGGKDRPAPATYELSFVQNPSLPTVDVYAQAPTTKRAIALANGAVTGFASFMSHLDANHVSPSQGIEVRQLGGATGGTVDPGADRKIAVLIFVGFVAMWCCLILFVSRVKADLRAARRSPTDELLAIPEPLPEPEAREARKLVLPSFAADLRRTSPAAAGRDVDDELSHSSPATRAESGPSSNGRAFVRP